MKNLSKGQMIDLLYKINRKLEDQGISGEILMAGGASLTLVYDTREGTKDIDALFEPSGAIRKIIEDIAREDDLDNDWLNDGVKGFIDTTRQNAETFLKLSNLTVKTIDAEGLLAMKLAAARMDTKDLNDALALMKHLNVSNIDQLYDIVEERMPPNQRTAQAGFFIQMAWENYNLQQRRMKAIEAEAVTAELSLTGDISTGKERSFSPKQDIAMGIDSARAQALGSERLRGKTL